MDRWLRTDEYVETITSLDMVCEQLPRVVDDLHRWKWVVISMHNALQGCMVLSLRGSNSLDIRPDKDKIKWLAAFKKKDGCFPKFFLDDFLKLYAKIQNPELMKRFADSRPFEPKETHADSVEMLTYLRNRFIHYFPSSLSLEVSGLPAMLSDCIDIANFLLFKCGNICWHDNETLATRAKKAIEEIQLQVKLLFPGHGE